MVKVYQPKVEVTLIKVVMRDRSVTEAATGPDTLIDLTPFLGESGVVQFSRGVNQPAGVFSVELVDQASLQTGDSVYSMIEPMDIVEIRMAREPHIYDQLPVVFRGFVHFIKRSEKMGSNGKPLRRVIVSGRDWGGLLQAIQLFYKKDYAIGQIMLNTFPMFVSYGVSFENLVPKDFVEKIVNAIVNPWLDELWLASSLEQALRLNVKASVTSGRVGPYTIQPFEGSIWSLLEQWTDFAWNEIIFEDDNSGSHLVYRARPYRDSSTGQLILDDAKEADRVSLDIDAVVSLDVERNLEQVANYYHVDTPQAYLNHPELINVEAMQKGSVYKTDYPNCDPAIYGLRKVTEISQMTSGENTHSAIGEKSQKIKTYAARHHTWMENRRDTLFAMRKDNVVLESGSMKLRGDERIKPGVEIEINRGGLRAVYYPINVTHTFEVFGTYTTEVQFIRGTGFIKRLAQPNYLNEKARGVYG